jgi:O-antigen ligase
LVFFENKAIRLNKITLPIILLFIFQSLSVINVLNINTFIYFFERLIAVSIFVFVCYLILNKKRLANKIIQIINFTVLINVCMELLMFFFPSLVNWLYRFIHQSVLDIFVFNINRGRLYFESYGEVFLPIILYLFIKEKNLLNKIIYWIVTLGVIMLAFWSNYRDRFVVVCFSLFTTLMIFRKDILKIRTRQNIIFLFATMLIFIGGFFYIYQTRGYSVIDRLLLQDKEEDIGSLVSRGILINEAVSIGRQFPLTGAGLGNYYDHLPSFMKNQRYRMIGQNRNFLDATLLYPHNLFAQIFVETGLLGLVSFLLILGIFIRQDFRILKKDNSISKALAISFWALILYSMFNPRTYLTFYTNFFILRILIGVFEKNI